MRTACPGCGVELPSLEGPVDPYGASSPACWAAYGEVMAREFSGAEHFAAHRGSVDAYMAQHPSPTSRAAVQSVWVHLAGLYLVLERGAAPAQAARIMAKLTAPRRTFEWLDPPPVGSALTVASVVGAVSAPAHREAVRVWGASVWGAWGAHHARIRALVEAP